MVIKNQSLFLSIAVGSIISLGSRGLVHVYGRNDMSIAQKMGVSWVVWDPDGIVAQLYSAWEDFTSAPGEEHHFRTPTGFDLNKSGTWTIEVALFMNFDDPVVVDSYNGTLCVVTGYAGTITRKELEYDGARGDIPVE